jgi:ParB-like chromosome segregation protein Spo0J
MDPKKITPNHEIRDPRKVAKLATSMRRNGWIGRPIIVVGDESQGDCRALTGTHRIAAAIAAGLDDIPVYWLDVPTVEAWERIDGAQEQEDILAAIMDIDKTAGKIYRQEPGII